MQFEFITLKLDEHAACKKIALLLRGVTDHSFFLHLVSLIGQQRCPFSMESSVLSVNLSLGGCDHAMIIGNGVDTILHQLPAIRCLLLTLSQY